MKIKPEFSNTSSLNKIENYSVRGFRHEQEYNLYINHTINSLPGLYFVCNQFGCDYENWFDQITFLLNPIFICPKCGSINIQFSWPHKADFGSQIIPAYVENYIEKLYFQKTNISNISASDYDYGHMPTYIIDNDEITFWRSVDIESFKLPINMLTVFKTWRRIRHSSKDSLSCWAISGSNVICTENTKSLVGFLSSVKTNKYICETTVSSTDYDDDGVGIIVSHVDVGSNLHSLFLIRDRNGLNTIWGLMYFNNGVITRIADDKFEIAKSFLTPYPWPWTDNSGHGWNSVPQGSKIYAERNDNIFTFKCSNYDGGDYIEGSEVIIDLNDYPELSEFIGPTYSGFGCISQKNSKFTNSYLEYQLDSHSIYIDLDTSKEIPTLDMFEMSGMNCPSDYFLWGSNDNITWHIIYQANNQNKYGSIFVPDNGLNYSHYKIDHFKGEIYTDALSVSHETQLEISNINLISLIPKQKIVESHIEQNTEDFYKWELHNYQVEPVNKIL